MPTMTFQVNDQSTDAASRPAIWITLEETEAGVKMTASVAGALTGDLRGVFFDLADETLIGKILAASATGLTEIRQGNDTVRDLGDGANMNGLLGSDKGYDIGLEIGTSGIGKDDFQAFSVVLSSLQRPLTLADFANVDFGVRTTSVGLEDGVRSASSKLLETTFTGIAVVDDEASVAEDGQTSGDLLGNDRAGLAAADTVTVTSWSGGQLGAVTMLDNTEGATLIVNADGSYTVDARASNALSAGESFTFTYSYSARNDHDGTSWATDSGTFTVTVHGLNDDPDAKDDEAGPIEKGDRIEIDVLENDSDIDRLDTLHVTGIQEADGNFVQTVTLASGATVMVNEDGTVNYDSSTLSDNLNAGEIFTDTFTYQISDGKGGFDIAEVQVRITDEGLTSSGIDRTPSPDNFRSMSQDLGNLVLYLEDGDRETPILKVKITPAGEIDGLGVRDIDVLNLPQFLTQQEGALAGNTTLLAVSIHTGQEYPNLAGSDGTRNGEGVFYLLNDDTPISPVGTRSQGTGWSSDWDVDDIPLTEQAQALGLTTELLAAAAAANYTFDYSNGSYSLLQ